MRNAKWFLIPVFTLALTACEPQDAAPVAAVATDDAAAPIALVSPEPVVSAPAPAYPVVPEPVDPSPSPSVEVSPSPSASPTLPAVTPSPSASPSASPAPSPSASAAPNTAPTWNVNDQAYLDSTYSYAAIIVDGAASDLEDASVTYKVEAQYYCTSGTAWGEVWNNPTHNSINVSVPTGNDRANYNVHWFVLSAADSQGLKAYRVLEVYWGGGATFGVYTHDVGTAYSTANFCGGAQVFGGAY